jgi:hypothetical protein
LQAEVGFDDKLRHFCSPFTSIPVSHAFAIFSFSNTSALHGRARRRAGPESS